jgi:hypothetical protein
MEVYFYEMGYECGYEVARNHLNADIDQLAQKQGVYPHCYENFRSGFEIGYTAGTKVS